MITVLGPDAEDRRFIASKLRPNVRLESVTLPERPTIRTRRYLEPNFLTKMFEVQYLDDAPVPEPSEQELHRRLAKEADRHECVAVADFGHGMMTERLREAISSFDTFVALNVQSNSANLGFNPVTKHRRANFVCIDEPELKLAADSQYGDVQPHAARVRHRLAADEVGIVATPTALLICAAQQLARLGAQRLLIEKPVSLWSEQIDRLADTLEAQGVEAWCA